MELQKKLSETLKNELSKFADDKKYKEFVDYYNKLLESSIARKQQYTIPLIKTIWKMPPKTG